MEPPTPSARAPPERRRVVGLLALIALGAIGVGVASVLLLPPAGSPPPPGGPGTFTGTTISFGTVGEVVAILAFGLLILILYMRFAGPGGTVPKRFFTIFLVYFLVSITFIALVHLIGAGPLTPGGNATAPPPGGTTGSGNMTGANGTNATNFTFQYPHYSVSFWWAILGAIGVAVAGLGVAVWYLGRPVRDRPRSQVQDRAKVGEALERALRALDGSTDPRSVLIALYAQLLQRIGGALPELEVATPREIERACVGELGIPAGPAAELRSLFERARYSSLPLDSADVDRARAALHDALAALKPSAVAA